MTSKKNPALSTAAKQRRTCLISPMRLKLALGAALLVILSFIATNIAVYEKIRSEQLEYSTRIAEENAARLSDRVKANMEQGLGIARILALTAENILADKNYPAPRDFLNKLLKTTISEYPTFLAAWMAMEPDAFSEADSTHAKSQGADSSGRFLPYWTLAGGLHVETCTDMENPETGNYYQIPKQTRKAYIDSPNTYAVNNQMTNLVTISVPILVNGQFKGVAGVDFSLDSISRAVKALAPAGQGYAMLMTNTGIAVAHENPNIIGLDIFKYDRELNEPALLQAIRSGMNYNRVVKKDGVNFYEIYIPIRFSDMSGSWTLLLAYPFQSPMESNPTAFILAAALTTLAAAAMLAWAWLIVKRHLAKVELLCQRTTALLSYPHTEPLVFPPGDELHGLSRAIESLVYDERHEADPPNHRAGSQ